MLPGAPRQPAPRICRVDTRNWAPFRWYSQLRWELEVVIANDYQPLDAGVTMLRMFAELHTCPAATELGLGIQYIDELDADNWGKLLLLMEAAHFVLPEPPVEPRRVEPTPAERIQYTVGGRTLIGKEAIAAMPSAEFARRLKEEPGFQSLVEEVETGGRLSTPQIGQDEKPSDYSSRIVLRNFPVTVGISKRGEELRDLTMAQVENELRADDYTRAMKLLGTPVKTLEAAQDSDGYIAEHLAARRQQWAR